MAEPVKLHYCPFTWLKVPGHACHEVRSALDDQGIDYEIVKNPGMPRSRRTDLVALTGQHHLPAIEFADGTAYKADHKAMIATIKAGDLFAQRAGSDA